MKEYKFRINGNDYRVAVENVQDGVAKVSVNGTAYTVEVEGDGTVAPRPVKPVEVAPATYHATPQPAPTKLPVGAPVSGAGEEPLRSPLPGTLLEVRVAVGDSVRAGQTVMILEAMKMENNIDAPRAGMVKSIAKRPGDSVMEGEVLLTVG